MRTEIVEVSSQELQKDKIERIAQTMKKGGVVAFPTETVYGLGADARNESAVKKIFKAKGRPSDNPLIVHVSKIEQVYLLVNEIPPFGLELMKQFWPGPLTLVMKKTNAVPDIVTAGLDTVAIRMPAHSVALAIIDAAGVPVAAPSANRSGKPSPTLPEHVIQDLDGRVDVIVRAGASIVGLESTVLDITCYPPMILRPGGVLPRQIQDICGDVSVLSTVMEGMKEDDTPKSPGMKYTHYSPKAKVIVFEGKPEHQMVKILEMSKSIEKEGKKVGILSTAENRRFYGANCIEAGSSADPQEIAANLFGLLRKFDEMAVDVILAEGISEEGMGLAVMNRLRKAAGHTIEYV